MPMRKIACISSPLALAEPVPFTFASLNAKSFTPTLLCWLYVHCAAMRIDEFELLHVPGGRGTSLRTQAAVDAKIFIFHHDARCLRQRRRSIKILIEIVRRRRQAAPATHLRRDRA